MSISVQTHQLRQVTSYFFPPANSTQSGFKQGPVFADEPENITQETLNNMNNALNTAENLDQLLSSGNSGSKQVKSYAQYSNPAHTI